MLLEDISETPGDSHRQAVYVCLFYLCKTRDSIETIAHSQIY